MLLAACEQFLGKAEQEIRRVALETLGKISIWQSWFLINISMILFFHKFSRVSEGHQRAIMGSMTVEVTNLPHLICL